MARRRKATGSGRDPSRLRNSTSTTGVFHPIRDDLHNRRTLADLGRNPPAPRSDQRNGDLVFESSHERDALVVLDVQPWVARLETQPETWLLDSGRHYTPDIRAESCSRDPLFIEVKPARFIMRDPSLAGRRGDIESAAAERRGTFVVMSEDAYREQARLENAHLLRHAARRDMPAGRARALEEIRLRPAGATLLELTLALRMGIGGRFAVLGLVALGVLAMDLDERIGPRSRVWLPEEGSHGES